MKQMSSMPLVAASVVFTVFLSFLSADAGAAELVVPTGFASIQAAIDAASPGDIVTVETGTYQELIRLNKAITVRGRETARTLLSGGGSGGPLFSVNGPTAAAIRNFTFIDASTGILVTSNTSTLSITNNVFNVGSGASNVAIDVRNSPQTEIINNVFLKNATAISRDSDIPIVNNIFSDNVTAILSTVTPTPPAANISNNAFFGAAIRNRTDTSPRGVSPFVEDAGAFVDPFFVNPAIRDFHLDIGSALKDRGAPSAGLDFDGTAPDLGAYGGPQADPIPFPVQGLTIGSFTQNSIDVEWQPNNSYLIDNGGYKLYYGHSTGLYNGREADGGLSHSPINVGGDTFFTLSDLTPAAATPDAPVLFPPEPRDGALALSWSFIPGATGYKVHYGELSAGQNTLDVGNTTAYTLTGLTNGQPYLLAVSAYVPSSSYYIAVTAFDSTPAAHESAFSQEVSVQLGGAPESGLSNIVTDFPDTVQAYPALPNGRHSCFIATAAYGSYSAPEVLALRAFRDRYLLPNAPGRRFVAWYYRRGPAAAALLNAHPAWKPVVRAALLPFIGMAIFMTGTTNLVKGAAALAIVSALALGFRRKRPSGTGDHR